MSITDEIQQVLTRFLVGLMFLLPTGSLKMHGLLWAESMQQSDRPILPRSLLTIVCIHASILTLVPHATDQGCYCFGCKSGFKAASEHTRDLFGSAQGNACSRELTARHAAAKGLTYMHAMFSHVSGRHKSLFGTIC